MYKTSVSGAYLARQAAKHAADLRYKTTRIKNLKGIANGLTSITKRIKYIDGTVEKTVKITKKVTEESGKMKKLWDALLKPMKGSGEVGKATASGKALAGLGIVSLALFTAQTKLTEFTQEAQIKSTDSIADSLSKVLAIAIRGVQQSHIANKDIAAQRLENQRTRDRVYSLEKLFTPIREKVNNITYEVRQGRKILDTGITAAKLAANNALAEARRYNTKQTNAISKLQADFNKYLSNAKDNFQQRIEATINALQKGLAEAQSASKQANQSISKANDSISLQSKIISSLQDAIKLIKPPTPADTKVITNEVIVKVKELFNPQLNKIPAIENKVIELSSANSTLKINVESFKLAQSYIDAAQNNKSDAIAGGVTNLVTAINQQNQNISQIKNGVVTSPVPELAKAVEIQQSKVQKIEIDLNNLKTQNTSLKSGLGGLDEKLKELDEVNKEGIEKLNRILPLVGLIPNIPQNTANTIKPSIPTVPQITQATGTAICNSANGGCLGDALNNQTNNINNNSNANKNGLLDAFNTGSNAASNAQLAEVLDRLGDKVPGGLSGKLVDGFKWLQLDRVLGVLTLIATIQNHLMLSNDIGQTLLGAINNGLALIGLKDDKGNAFDLGGVINSTAENLIKGIVGAENYTQLSAGWAKANRIYQATTNILNSFQGLAQTILSANELIGAYTGRIGNALKKAGQVLENAYPWMNPEPKFNRVTQGLEALQQGASTVQQVTQAPLDIVNQTTELTNAATEFTKAIKEDNKPENKSTVAVEPDKIKADAVATKAASASPLFDLSDFFNADN